MWNCINVGLGKGRVPVKLSITLWGSCATGSIEGVIYHNPRNFTFSAESTSACVYTQCARMCVNLFFRLLARPVWMTCLSNVWAKLWTAPGRNKDGGRILTQLTPFHCLELEGCSQLPARSLPVWENGARGDSHFHYVLNWADFLPWTRCPYSHMLEHAHWYTCIYTIKTKNVCFLLSVLTAWELQAKSVLVWF